MGIVAEVLANGSCSTALGRRLYALAGELGRMAGWAAFDAGAHAAAQRYWSAALHAAHSAGDRLLGANVLKSMSLQCYDFDQPAEALALARSAYEAAGQVATPRTRAMLALREARAHAALGDRGACERLVAAADGAMALAGAHDVDPTWLTYFDVAEVYGQIGTCYLDLGQRVPARLTAADSYLARTLEMMPEAKVRDRATYLTRRASAQALLGNVDHACHLLADTIPLVQAAPSERNAQRLLRARRRLPSGRRDLRVRELDDQLAELGAIA